LRLSGAILSARHHDEHLAICASVQRGLRSRHYDRGRFSVKRENGVHHFHGLLAEHLKLNQSI